MRDLCLIDEVLELLMDLGASDEQIDCPFVFASAKSGIATLDLGSPGASMKPLFETIVDYIPAPEGDPDAGTQMLISTIDYNEYIGRIGVGKVDNGVIRTGQDCVIVNHHNPDMHRKVRVSKLYEFEGLKRVEVQEAGIGSIVAISGIDDLHIGDTLCSPESPEAIPFQKISEPTIAMTFNVNDSPLAGRDGKYVTSRHIRDRLYRELNTDARRKSSIIMTKRASAWSPSRSASSMSRRNLPAASSRSWARERANWSIWHLFREIIPA